ncbi:MAG TPA: universal stress protein [Tepidiformaceae bacterium]
MARIVVPLDESPLAEQSLPWAAGFARAAGHVLHLVSVCPSDSEFWESVDVDPESPINWATETVSAYLSGVATNPDFHGLRVSTELRFGDVAGEITRVAAEPGTEMVVITSRGRGAGPAPGYGSVTVRLIRRLGVPVVVIPPESPVAKVNAILVPLDGSPEAENALAFARPLARTLGAKVHLLTVLNPDVGPGIPEATGARATAVLADRAAEYLADRAVGEDERAIAWGRFSGTILNYAREHDCQLIAVSTHGRGGAIQLELGTTADAVIREADRPVLLVPVRGQGSAHAEPTTG